MHVLTRRAAVIAGTAAVVLGSAAGIASAGGAPVLSWSAPGVSAGTFNYGIVTGGSTAPQTFTLTNTGGSASAALTVTVTGPAFTLLADTCTGTSLGPRRSCIVTVAYQPGTGGGTDTGTLTASGVKSAATASLRLSGTVPDTVTVTGPGNQDSTAGDSPSLQMAATDSASGQTLIWSATGLPHGLLIDSNGVISGTPTAAGTYPVTVTATDTTGAQGSAQFTWTVFSKLTVTFPGNQTSTTGAPVSLQMTATDPASGQLPVWSASGLPDGLAISALTGVISGTPTTAETYVVEVRAIDGTGGVDSQIFTWTVNPANTVTVSNPGDQNSGRNSVSVQMTAIDSDPLQTLTWSAIGLPDGLSIDSSTGLISGYSNLLSPVTVSVTVTATDTTGASGSVVISWTVGGGPHEEP